MADGPKKIALTGGIASGKSMASDYLIREGIPVIDADQVVHHLLRTDEALKGQIREAFGADVFDAAGDIDRARLGQQVFSDPARRRLLESWIHPKVRMAIEAFFMGHADQPLAVAVIPLLFESDLAHHYDEVWLIETPENLQVARLIQSRGMTEAEARNRIASQMPLSEKMSRAKALPNAHILSNSDTPEVLFARIARLLGRT